MAKIEKDQDATLTSSSEYKEFLKNHKEWVEIVTYAPILIFGLPKIYKEATGNIELTALGVITAIWLFLFWVYQKRVKSNILVAGQCQYLPRFKRGRKLARVGIYILP